MDKRYDELFDMLEKKTLRKRYKGTNRKDFPEYRGALFGFVRPRFHYKGYLELSLDSKTFPEIYKLLVDIGKDIVPFEFKTIQVNKNLICPPHKDNNNKGKSCLVSFGNYSGCNTIVGDTEYNTNRNPVVFDGSKILHYNTNDLSGTKYSVIYFQ